MFEKLKDKLLSGEWLTLETTPAKAASFAPIVERLRALDLPRFVDGFTVTDNPLAKLRYGSLFAAVKLQEAFGKPVLATLSMRDRNLIALQSDILGCNEFGIRAFLAVTGDSASLSDQPHAKGVFESNSNELLSIMRSFNFGIDYAGKAIDPAPQPIYPFAVTQSRTKNPASLMRKIAGKIEHGAIGIITQPVFSIADARRLAEIFDEARREFKDERQNARLIVGVFPLTRLKTAQFLHAHVPGIEVADSWIAALSEANRLSAQEEERVGFELSSELFHALRDEGFAVHLMCANRFELAAKLLTSA
ncbi:hypothetical protein AGMMS50229_08500 [Campylobacterota bacterium]|nr:hypothetical protein AGMMS50229_08310 [Campylobacterota bacterium]GHV05426.1 hypothetical protein AGMMS50229_08500 [Campylobacterota bacterium]